MNRDEWIVSVLAKLDKDYGLPFKAPLQQQWVRGAMEMCWRRHMTTHDAAFDIANAWQQRGKD